MGHGYGSSREVSSVAIARARARPGPHRNAASGTCVRVWRSGLALNPVRRRSLDSQEDLENPMSDSGRGTSYASRVRGAAESARACSNCVSARFTQRVAPLCGSSTRTHEFHRSTTITAPGTGGIGFEVGVRCMRANPSFDGTLGANNFKQVGDGNAQQRSRVSPQDGELRIRAACSNR